MSLAPEKFLELLKQQIESNLRQRTGGPLMSKQDAFDFREFNTNAAFESEILTTGLKVKEIIHNATPAVLYEHALRNERGSFITKSGALVVSSGAKTGRSPADKRIVDNPQGQFGGVN
jgi:phosphoenolpyruvate carboxykinase (ATP)